LLLCWVGSAYTEKDAHSRVDVLPPSGQPSLRFAGKFTKTRPKCQALSPSLSLQLLRRLPRPSYVPLTPEKSWHTSSAAIDPRRSPRGALPKAHRASGSATRSYLSARGRQVTSQGAGNRETQDTGAPGVYGHPRQGVFGHSPFRYPGQKPGRKAQAFSHCSLSSLAAAGTVFILSPIEPHSKLTKSR